jgi:hypothetical protein
MGVDIVWDSTHFADGMQVVVKVEATDDLGCYDTMSYIVTAYNKAYALGNSVSTFQGPEAARRIAIRAGEMNHTVRQSINDDEIAILINIPTYTAFFIWTHGNAGIFGDCVATVMFDPAHYLDTNEVGQAVASKTANQPPYNFVHIHACCNASDDTIANAFGIGGAAIDRAFLGYSTLVQDNLHNVNWVNQVWASLRDGKTVNAAVQEATTIYGAPDANAAGDRAAAPVILGDSSMKLHSVYGGTPGQWYRILGS